ncbi:MAG TPA: histidine phosphatase family protein [Candidatus Baltobacteraceae bacterium]|jgi:probable phosphoglycerate mutase|nr:histidine phosphatase family protein [Candidatus Baltobacteraceae bacterium]
MREIVLLRHGATEHNAAGRFLSNDDPPLSDAGRAACRSVAEALASISPARVFVSPRRRTLETRELVAPVTPYEICDELREVDFGAWEGKTLEWLEQNDAERLAARRRDPVRFRPPGGESFEDAAPRLRAVAERLNGDGNVLVIGHRGSLGVLERILRGLALDAKDVTPMEPSEFRIVRA